MTSRRFITTAIAATTLAAFTPSAAVASPYTDSRDLCRLYTPSQIAHAYGGPRHPTRRQAARAYARHAYQRRYRHRAFLGCLAGLRSK